MDASKVKILVVFRDDQARSVVVQNLRFRTKDSKDIHEMRSIEEAIDHLESRRDEYGLIIFESRGSGRTLIRAMIELGRDSSFVVCGTDEQSISEFKGSEIPVVFVHLDALSDQIGKTIKSLELTGKIPFFEENEKEYIAIRAEMLPPLGPLPSVVFMMILGGRYVPVFKKGDLVTKADIQHYLEKNPDQMFYLKRSESGTVLDSQMEKLDSVMNENPVDSGKVEQVITQNFGIVRDVITQIGFTPEAQRVAVSSVLITIRLLESKPKLRTILEDLKNKEGSYITSHSIYLGKVACALAHKVGWRSQSTYFKLSLAAFLHDMSLREDLHARVFDLEKFESSGRGTPEEVRDIRLHPARAAEYARQFEEIPSEVEQIVSQHHERPDGSGFPRGLVVRYFTPLSALFVIAQDLVEYSNSNKVLSFDDFFEEKTLDYNVGIFRKLARALRTDTTLI